MELVTYQSYTQFKQELDREIRKEAEGFVKIGYLLRLAADSDILADSGYGNVNEFAKAEYGLDKSQVSRFMAINERFSQNGYSAELDLQYQGYGVAKLGIMLQLPDSVNEQLSPELSKADINTIKEEYKEEQKITDIEVMLEPKSMDPVLEQALNKIMYEHPDIYAEIWEENRKAHNFNIETSSDDFAQDVLAASGDAVYTVRLEGIGKVMLVIKSGARQIKITNMRTGEVIEPKWEDLGYILCEIPKMDSAEKEWENKYNEKWPIKEEPKEEKKPAKVITTPKKEEPKIEKAWGVDKKEPEKPINTQCEEDSDEKEQLQQATEDKMPENVDSTQCETTSTEPIEKMEIEPVEEEIEEVEPADYTELDKVAPVQQPESIDFTQSRENFDQAKAVGEFLAKGFEEGIKPIVETKTLIQLKDDVVKLLGEVIGLIYESKWVEVQTKLEDVDFMVKGCISEEIRLADEEEEDEE